MRHARPPAASTPRLQTAKSRRRRLRTTNSKERLEGVLIVAVVVPCALHGCVLAATYLSNPARGRVRLRHLDEVDTIPLPGAPQVDLLWAAFLEQEVCLLQPAG
eukprot:CAMPEP_0176100808 /NCGR_PEP_ID=MMETSP0120_2-20121206/50560_1 /TAXON_ID=160619 /ORGANISM="Kryptoperidinium foliaceum, Strain CCMP 1326" /LENGTH=103 /DNA_ID=CAMNT_0017434853 /DNA_START=45 /DNA_END=353 /DNA_ORIENTATION=-